LSAWAWLRSKVQSSPQILQVVVLPFITYDTCRSIYSIIEPSTNCAGERKGGKAASIVSIPSFVEVIRNLTCGFSSAGLLLINQLISVVIQVYGVICISARVFSFDK